jgi:hypothetical protein
VAVEKAWALPTVEHKANVPTVEVLDLQGEDNTFFFFLFLLVNSTMHFVTN